MCHNSKEQKTTERYINFSSYYFQYIFHNIIFININNIYYFTISMLPPTVLRAGFSPCAEHPKCSFKAKGCS